MSSQSQAGSPSTVLNLWIYNRASKEADGWGTWHDVQCQGRRWRT